MTQHALAAGQRPSWLPPLSLIGVKVLELRKRRTLMIVTAAFTVALPVVFYLVRLALHLGNAAHYGPAGTSDAFAIAGGLMDEFGFIVAVALGASAGTTDVTDGMFRHLVITGRSRLALYLARIPAGLLILLGLNAAGITVAALATAFLGGSHPAGALSAGALAAAGGWLELDLVIGFTAGLGLGSLMGQRTVPIIVLIMLEIIITPVLTNHSLPGMVDIQRLIVGVPMDQLKPAALAGSIHIGPGGGPAGLRIPPMPAWAMITVIAGWIVGWPAIGAWKMTTRDA